jgi:hypothetical protein
MEEKIQWKETISLISSEWTVLKLNYSFLAQDRDLMKTYRCYNVYNFLWKLG